MAIPSVSADAEHRPEVVKMAHWTVDQLKALGAHDIELRELGVQEGTEDLQLPPLCLPSTAMMPTRRTSLSTAI